MIIVIVIQFIIQHEVVCCFISTCTLFSKRNATFLRLSFFWKRVYTSEYGVIKTLCQGHCRVYYYYLTGLPSQTLFVNQRTFITFPQPQAEPYVPNRYGVVTFLLSDSCFNRMLSISSRMFSLHICTDVIDLCTSKYPAQTERVSSCAQFIT